MPLKGIDEGELRGSICLFHAHLYPYSDVAACLRTVGRMPYFSSMLKTASKSWPEFMAATQRLSIS